MIQMESFKQELAGIRRMLAEAGESLQIDHLREQMAEYQEDMGSPGFWDEPERAQKVSAKASQVERRIQHYESLSAKADDVEVLMELAEEADDEEMAGEISAELNALNTRLAERAQTVVELRDGTLRVVKGEISWTS